MLKFHPDKDILALLSRLLWNDLLMPWWTNCTLASSR
jgi:hypothetical protein